MQFDNMSFTPTSVLFEIVSSSTKGSVLTATEDILPGQILIEEKALLIVSDEEAKSTQYVKLSESVGIPGVIFVLFNEFKQLTHENQSKVMGLFGPTNGMKAHTCRSNVLNYARLHSWTEREVDSFVKVAMVYTYNCFGGDGNARVIFDMSSRLRHSCQPNCILNRFDTNCEVRSISSITKGDKLTIAYNDFFNDKPTHVRRVNYETFKDFTCECPRCSALGDDTRQFNCFDKTCSGRHYTCQPTSDAAPLLLPCITCGFVPSREFEAEMLELEGQLPQLLMTIQSQFKRLVNSKTVDFGPLSLKAVSHHRQSVPIATLICRVMRRRGDKMGLLEAAKTAMKVFDYSLLFPNVITAEACYHYSGHFLFTACTEGLELALRYAQQAVKMHALLNGRDKRDEQFDMRLTEILLKDQIRLRHWTAKLADLSLCQFCGETPQRAVLTLTVCAACNQAAYCSEGCQKAHSEVHRENCVQDV